MKESLKMHDHENKCAGYCVIATVLKMDMPLPAKINDNLSLEKASLSEQKEIMNYLPGDWNNHYNAQCTKQGDSIKHTLMPQDEWRYYVVKYKKGPNDEIQKFFDISDLIYPYLESCIFFSTKENLGEIESSGQGSNLYHAQNFYYSNRTDEKTFTQNHFDNLVALFTKYQKLLDEKNEYEGILRAIDTHTGLRQLTPINDLEVLVCFIIIEMLLTHKPQKTGSPSLTHQVKEKMNFLSTNFLPQLDYSKFTSDNPYKIWDALYNYRSVIAHGGHINFKDREMCILKNKTAALQFLKDATKALLVYSINEPKIVNKLKVM